MLAMPTHRSLPRPARATGTALVVGAALLAGTLGCTATSSSSGPAGSTPSSGPGAGAAPVTAYATVADLQKALTDKGITCKLEYPGLKDDTQKQELSICVIDGEQAYLRIWFDTAALGQFIASPDGQTGTVAAGSNWTITVTSPAVATRIAGAIGGTAPSANAPTGSTPGSR